MRKDVSALNSDERVQLYFLGEISEYDLTDKDVLELQNWVMDAIMRKKGKSLAKHSKMMAAVH